MAEPVLRFRQVDGLADIGGDAAFARCHALAIGGYRIVVAVEVDIGARQCVPPPVGLFILVDVFWPVRAAGANALQNRNRLIRLAQ